MSTALSARSTAPVPDGPATSLTRQQKAAVIVRLALSAGIKLDLSRLSPEQQATLVRRMSELRGLDQATVDAVAEEFLARLEASGLSLPLALRDALAIAAPTIDPAVTRQLRKEAGLPPYEDAWTRVSLAEVDDLLPLVAAERTEIAAVILSKLPVNKAARIMGKLPGEQARRIALAVARTETIAPKVVERIGNTLAETLDMRPELAFELGPDRRVGEILNFSPAQMRDEVLEGLEETDAEFAQRVRRAIFTFEHIARRIDAKDIPTIVREVDQTQLVLAMAGATGKYEETRDFILQNMSKRLADQMQEDMADLGPVKPADAEEAMNAVVMRVRELISAGEITLAEEPEEEEAQG